jgi:E3 ubiquitin-protein ligase synoviolin
MPTMPVNEVLRERTQAVASTLNSHRVFLYALVSTLAVSATIANALKNQSNFYSVAICLSKSNRSVLVCVSCSLFESCTDSLTQILANFGFILSLLCGRIVQQIFFGALRPAEVEVIIAKYLEPANHLRKLPSISAYMTDSGSLSLNHS